MGSLVLIAIVVMFVLLIPRREPTYGGHGFTVSRSRAYVPPSDCSTCGGCHGTGQEGLGLADWGDCSMCDGRGYFKRDPNAKTYTLQEFMDMMEARKVSSDVGDKDG